MEDNDNDNNDNDNDNKFGPQDDGLSAVLQLGIVTATPDADGPAQGQESQLAVTLVIHRPMINDNLLPYVVLTPAEALQLARTLNRIATMAAVEQFIKEIGIKEWGQGPGPGSQ